MIAAYITLIVFLFITVVLLSEEGSNFAAFGFSLFSLFIAVALGITELSENQLMSEIDSDQYEEFQKMTLDTEFKYDTSKILDDKTVTVSEFRKISKAYSDHKLDSIKKSLSK